MHCMLYSNIIMNVHAYHMYAGMKIHNQSISYLKQGVAWLAVTTYIHKFKSVRNIAYSKHLKLVRMKISPLMFVLVTSVALCYSFQGGKTAQEKQCMLYATSFLYYNA